MAIVHIVEQGETLQRIALKYKFSDFSVIYNHPSNEAFRSLRPDPNLLLPGDEINIPDKQQKTATSSTSSKSQYTVKQKKQEKLILKIESPEGESCKGKKVILTVGTQTFQEVLGDSSTLEVELTDQPQKAKLKLFLDSSSDQYTNEFDLNLGCLDPVESLSGVQARCNALGFECGLVDGINGKNTKHGVRLFQEAYGLKVDEIPGSKTQAKLVSVYGC